MTTALPDEPLPVSIQARHKWAFHLLMADGLARRLEEWPQPTSMPLYAGWFPTLAPGPLRQQTGEILRQVLRGTPEPAAPTAQAGERPPAEAAVHHLQPSWTMYLLLYAFPFRIRPAPSFEPDFPPLSFLRSDFPPPLGPIWAQTGFPHVIAAAWLLTLYHPILTSHVNLNPAWCAFYQRQLLEWRIRRHWVQEWQPVAERANLKLPGWLLNENQDPWTMLGDGRADWATIMLTLDAQTQPPDGWDTLSATDRLARVFTEDWHARSWSPESPYRRSRQPPSPPGDVRTPAGLLAHSWYVHPGLGQRIGMLMEQRAVLNFFAPLQKYFAGVSVEDTARYLLTPEAVAVWADFHATGLPPEYEVF